MSEPGKAVFLSYASQDAEAARRICEALRAAGVEVWFDQNELVGGDAWDAKIRRQIAECALFVPIVSANTQARREGYFRLEWKLAAQRTHMIADGTPFVLPVVIDATRDAEALVPAEFKAVQWTRLALPTANGSTGGKSAVEAFAARARSLLSGPPPETPAAELSAGGRALPSRSPRTSWIFGALAAAVVGALALWRPWTPPAGPAPVSESATLVQRARDMIYDPDAARHEFALADGFLKRATELAPDSASAWGASALLHFYFYVRAYDPVESRLERARAEAEKALRLDGRTFDALLALGMLRQRADEPQRAHQLLEQARALEPRNPRVILALSGAIEEREERVKFLLRAAEESPRPAELLYYASGQLLALRRVDEALAALERAIAAQPIWRALLQRAYLEYQTTADPARVGPLLDRIPELKRDEPRVAIMRWRMALVRRDGAAAERALTAVPGDYFEDNFFSGPKAFLLAQAHELAGRSSRATEQWQLAARSLREKLAGTPGDPLWRAMLALTLAAQGETGAARELADACRTDERLVTVVVPVAFSQRSWREVDALEFLAQAYARLGDRARAVEMLHRNMSIPTRVPVGVTAATLAAEPIWDPLRGYPEFDRLVGSRGGQAPRALESTAPAAPDKSIAVLAFANRHSEKDSEGFAEGISQELSVVLGKVPGLRVANGASAASLQGSNVAEAEIARKLGVAYLVTGSVQRLDPKVRITARLIQASDGFQLWAESFTEELKDIFALQDRIAGLIAQNLQLMLGTDARRTRTVNPEAHRLVLEGRHFWNQRNEDGFARAEQAFARAIQLDATFAEAHAGLAGVYVIRAIYRQLGDSATRYSEDMRRARSAAQKAVELDPLLAEAHAVLAYVRMSDRELPAAERAMEQALRLNPNSATAQCWMGVLQLISGRIDRALERFAHAADLDPLWFINLQNWSESLFYVGRYQEALQVSDRAMALRKDAFVPHVGLRAQILFALGRRDEAVQLARSLRADLSADTRWIADAGAIRILRLSGHPDEAGAYAEDVLARLDPSTTVRAQVLAAAGRFDDACATLGQARAIELRQLFYEPLWDPWRDDPRFLGALAQLGCAKEYQRARETLARMKQEARGEK